MRYNAAKRLSSRSLGHDPEDRQPAAGPQHGGGPGGTDDRVDPVPRLAGDDGVEGTPGGVPLLEPGRGDLDPAAPGELGHPRVRLDTQHPTAGGAELPGGDPGAAADVEQVGAGTAGH